MKVFIFLNPNSTRAGPKFYKMHFENNKKEGDMIICADGGYTTAVSLGITPHLVVGDMDSLEGTVIHESVQWEKFPQEKDYSDFEIALRRSRGMNPEVIMVYGAVGGGRKDHEITNIVLLAYADLPVQFIEEDVEVYNVPGRLEVAGRKGCTCSLVSFGTGSYIVDMSGFRYTMKEQVLKPSSRGLSNVITEDPAVILPGRGDLVMIINKEKVVNPHQI